MERIVYGVVGILIILLVLYRTLDPGRRKFGSRLYDIPRPLWLLLAAAFLALAAGWIK